MDDVSQVRCVEASRAIFHPSSYAVASLEAGLKAHGVVGSSFVRDRITRKALRVFAGSGAFRSRRLRTRATYIVPMMGPTEEFFFPYCYVGKIVPYIYDCIPSQYELWNAIFARHDIEAAAFSARDSMLAFRTRRPTMRSCWMPEAVDPSAYVATTPWDERSIDVLEFGRKYDRYHDAVTRTLAQAGAKHLYQRTSTAVLFPTREGFVEALGQTRISICFPQSLTHPERFTGIETVTHRYFESMASGCIVVGKAPQELIDLFGYDPVVEVDWSRPADQLLDILRDPGALSALVKKNLESVLRVASYERRAAELLAFARGGDGERVGVGGR